MDRTQIVLLGLPLFLFFFNLLNLFTVRPPSPPPHKAPPTPLSASKYVFSLFLFPDSYSPFLSSSLQWCVAFSDRSFSLSTLTSASGLPHLFRLTFITLPNWKLPLPPSFQNSIFSESRFHRAFASEAGNAASDTLPCNVGRNTVSVFSHKRQSVSVGTSIAAFVLAVLEGSKRPGVWFPEEAEGIAIEAREVLLQRAAQGTINFVTNKPAWMVETIPKELGLGIYV